jgi:hypothetical protein
MDNNLPIHIRMFNERVRAMNQTNSKVLTLNPHEARNLHAEIYDLMATIANLSRQPTQIAPTVTKINMDGGTFK